MEKSKNNSFLRRTLPFLIAFPSAFYFTFFLDTKYGRESYPVLTFITKALPSFSFALYIYLNSSFDKKISIYHKCLIIAFIHAGIGDEFLEIDSIVRYFSTGNTERGIYYYIGGYFFFIAQCLFAISFYYRVGKISIWHYISQLTIFIFTLSRMIPHIHTKIYFFVTISYELAINSVSFFAFNKPTETFRNNQKIKNYLIPIGSAIFMFSDMIVLTPGVIGNISKRTSTIIVMTTYYIALLFFLIGGFGDKHYKSYENKVKEKKLEKKDTKENSSK